jgi:hypothetical protein
MIRNIIATMMIVSYLGLFIMDGCSGSWKTSIQAFCLAIVNYIMFFMQKG